MIIDRAFSGRFTLIAEIGVNYYDIATKFDVSPMEAAKLMIDEAVKSGIHAVKFQSYKAETLVTRMARSYWNTSKEPITSQFELFKKFDSFAEREYADLSSYCNGKGIEFLSTPFDFQSVDYLDTMMEVYKISSSDITNFPFIGYIAKKGKPIILSTGASEQGEIEAAVSLIRRHNDSEIVLMHCVLEYPTPYEHANLRRIATLSARFPETIPGYSDHTVPDANYECVKAAYTLGAVVIEKHFTLDKALPGNDHYHAMDAIDAKSILDSVKYVNAILGAGDAGYGVGEAVSRQHARRSIVTTRSLKAGEEIKADDITFKRPGTGIAPSDLSKLFGKTCRVDIPEDTTLVWGMFE